MRILLVEDDPATSHAIELMLSREGLKTDCARLGEEGIDLAKVYPYDLIVLDLNLPDISGHEVLRHLRQSLIETPILILSGDDDIESKIKGFGFGADDYMSKPFDRSELVARIKAIIRRSKGYSHPLIRIGDLEVNVEARTVEYQGTALRVTGKEYQILELLALQRGTVMTKEEFMNHLYGGLNEPETKIIDVFVCKLRRKLAEASGGQDYIQTIWGRGYAMRDRAIVEVRLQIPA